MHETYPESSDTLVTVPSAATVMRPDFCRSSSESRLPATRQRGPYLFAARRKLLLEFRIGDLLAAAEGLSWSSLKLRTTRPVERTKASGLASPTRATPGDGTMLCGSHGPYANVRIGPPETSHNRGRPQRAKRPRIGATAPRTL